MDKMGNHFTAGHFVFRHSCRIGLVLLMLLAGSCSERNMDAPLPNKVHVAGWSNTQFADTTLFHSAEVSTAGQDDCTKCHDLDGKGTEAIPGCFACHFGPDGSSVPPGSDWTHGLDRHEPFEDEQDVCNACHDQGRTYGTGPAVCHDCHGSGVTHVLGRPWLDNTQPGYHGSQSQENCASCHALSVRCSQCHFGTDGDKAPVGSGWEHGNNEEHENFEANIDTCNQCHALNRSYGKEPATCHDCHEGVENHVLGRSWLDPNGAEFHGTPPQTDLACDACHVPSVRCSQCHFGTTGSRTPAGSGWEHGNNDQHKTFESRIDTCNQCHTLNRSYGNGPASCHDCHEIETHVLGRAWLDSTQSSYHGNQPQQDCASCHDLSNECSQCHFGATGSKSPPGSNWPHGRIDNHNDQKRYEQVCIQCHTLTKAYRNEPDDPHCLVCHDD